MGRINVEAKLYGADETVEQSVTLDTEGRSTLEISVLADVYTTVRLDVSVDDSTWISNYKTWTGQNTLKIGFMNAYRFVRLRSDAAGGSGDKISLVLTAGG